MNEKTSTGFEWIPEHSYGISLKRAIELGEDPEYPRISAAVFRFDQLTPGEQETVISLKKRELEEAEQEGRQINIDIRKSATVDRSLHIRHDTSYYSHLKKQNRDRIEGLERQIKDMSAKVPKEYESPGTELNRGTKSSKLRITTRIRHKDRRSPPIGIQGIGT